MNIGYKRICYVRCGVSSKEERLSAHDTFDTRVSFDGTWKKRGRSTHIGLQAAILYDVGCVIDFNIFCTDCRMFIRMKKEIADKESDAYQS